MTRRCTGDGYRATGQPLSPTQHDHSATRRTRHVNIIETELADAGRASRLGVPRFNPEVGGSIDSLGEGAGGVASQVCLLSPRKTLLDAVVVHIHGVVRGAHADASSRHLQDSSVVMGGSSSLEKKVEHVTPQCWELLRLGDSPPRRSG